MITDINLDIIKNEKNFKDLFVNASFSTLSLNCNILKSSFYSDSFYYFPILNNDLTFSSLFTRDSSNLSHFFKFI